jgi:hypothetical protein
VTEIYKGFLAGLLALAIATFGWAAIEYIVLMLFC